MYIQVKSYKLNEADTEGIEMISLMKDLQEEEVWLNDIVLKILPEELQTKRETCSSPHDPGPADISWEGKETISEEWKIKREASSFPHDTGPAIFSLG